MEQVLEQTTTEEKIDLRGLRIKFQNQLLTRFVQDTLRITALCNQLNESDLALFNNFKIQQFAAMLAAEDERDWSSLTSDEQAKYIDVVCLGNENILTTLQDLKAYVATGQDDIDNHLLNGLMLKSALVSLPALLLSQEAQLDFLNSLLLNKE